MTTREKIDECFTGLYMSTSGGPSVKAAQDAFGVLADVLDEQAAKEGIRFKLRILLPGDAALMRNVEWEALPREGEVIEVGGDLRTVKLVAYDINGLPTVNLGLVNTPIHLPERLREEGWY